MKKFIPLLLLTLLMGCVNYSSLCQGDEPGQYYIIRRQSFVFFSHLHVVELQKALNGPDKGKMRYVRRVYPVELDDERPVQPDNPPPKPKEESGQESPTKKEKGHPRQWGQW